MLKRIGNVTFVGTSHIAKQSVRQITRIIEQEKPEIVCVELDRQRLHGLMNKTREHLSISMARTIGFRGYAFALLGSWAAKKMGKLVGVEPGSDMKSAVIEGRKHGATIALIDQPIYITLRQFSSRLTAKEIFRFFGDAIKGFFKRQSLPFDLTGVPEEKIILKLMDYMRVRYPNVYDVLVHRRNIYMIRKINALRTKFPDKKILVVVGAGHIQGITDAFTGDSITYSVPTGFSVRFNS